MKIKISFLLIVLVIFVGVLSVMVFSQKNTKLVQFPTLTAPILLPQVSPSPFPFEELTIPYLRNRKYESKLKIEQQIGTNINYTSHIASYDSDGLKINGLLTVPTDQKTKHPAIIFIHGYIPPAQYRTKVNYASYIDYFAKEGFVVYKIDLRGHDQSEGEAGGAYFSGDYIIDTLNAYAALQSSEFVDPNKIGLWGHSMAGNMVFRSLAVKQDIPAVVIWAGAVYTYSDMQEFRISDGSYQPPPVNSERARKRQLLRETHGDFDPNHWFWKQVPATNYLDGISGAVQIHHAIDDNVVSIDYSRNLMKILDGTSISHELVEYPSSGHNLTGSTFTQAMQKSVEFFREKM